MWQIFVMFFFVLFNKCLDQRKINRLINMSGSTVDGAIEAAGWIILDLVKGYYKTWNTYSP